MKKIAIFTFVTLFITAPALAKVSKNSKSTERKITSENSVGSKEEVAENLIKDMKKFKVEDLAKDAENIKSQKKLNIDLMFESLQQTVSYCESRTCSEELIHWALKVSLITMTKDMTDYGAEILAPLYAKNKETFNKAAARLTESDKFRILGALQSILREEEKGNG